MASARSNVPEDGSSPAAVSTAPPSSPIYLEVLPARATPPRPRACPRHQRPLDLFCCEDEVTVCEVCRRHGHEGHRVLRPREERKERQKALSQMQAVVQKRIQATEKRLVELPHVARQHQASAQALKRESAAVFSELVGNVRLTGVRVGELLGDREASRGGRAEARLHRLEQEAAALRRRSEELSRLAGLQDDVCFLKNFAVTEEATLSQEEEEEEEEEEVVASVRSAMKELRESIQELCDASLAKINTLVNPDPGAPPPGGAAALAAALVSTASAQAASSNSADATTRDPPPSLPPRPGLLQAPRPPLPPRQPQTSPVTPAEHVLNVEPKAREEMLKFRFQPTMDANTAYRHVQLSDGGRKAAVRAEDLNPPDHAERFHFWRQALCREALAGRPYYWEVEWTGRKVTIGVAYREMERQASDDSSRLGHNARSWSLSWSASGFSFWHGGEGQLLCSPKARRIGVYLDQHAGVLAFYRIARNQAELIHQHLSRFTGPLLPGFGFWPGGGSTVTVCQLD